MIVYIDRIYLKIHFNIKEIGFQYTIKTESESPLLVSKSLCHSSLLGERVKLNARANIKLNCSATYKL